MSKTLVVSDAFWTEMQQLVSGAAPQQPPSGGTTTPPSTPPSVPGGTHVRFIPWGHTAGLPNATIPPGETIAFAFTPPDGSNSGGALGNFSIAPTGDSDDFPRTMCISDKPGDFSGALAPQAVMRGKDALATYFSVGGYPIGRYNRVDRSNANLTPGVTYYVNVKQDDPTLQCTINYGLAP